MRLQKIGLFNLAYDPLPGISSAGLNDSGQAAASRAKMMNVHVQSEPRIDQDVYLGSLVEQLYTPLSAAPR